MVIIMTDINIAYKITNIDDITLKNNIKTVREYFLTFLNEITMSSIYNTERNKHYKKLNNKTGTKKTHYFCYCIKRKIF